MQRGFPVELLGLIRCSADGGALLPPGGHEPYIESGGVRCARCDRLHTIRDGILALLDEPALHPESVAEMRARDQRNHAILRGERREWRSSVAEILEDRPTLSALGPLDGARVCEIGCGAGRYTMAAARRAAAVVAVDLSRPGLLVVRRKLEATACVALVQADVTRPFAATGAFDAILSTLHSNLPTRDARASCLREIARITADGGRAVVSMHHRNVRDLFTPAVGRYSDSGIYRQFLRTPESTAEASPYFGRVTHRYIAVSVPGVRSLAVSQAVARVPGLRSALSRLFLAIGERPVRAAEEASRCA